VTNHPAIEVRGCSSPGTAGNRGNREAIGRGNTGEKGPGSIIKSKREGASVIDFSLGGFN
jgi:hypothetical protein